MKSRSISISISIKKGWTSMTGDAPAPTMGCANVLFCFWVSRFFFLFFSLSWVFYKGNIHTTRDADNIGNGIYGAARLDLTDTNFYGRGDGDA